MFLFVSCDFKFNIFEFIGQSDTCEHVDVYFDYFLMFYCFMDQMINGETDRSIDEEKALKSLMNRFWSGCSACFQETCFSERGLFSSIKETRKHTNVDTQEKKITFIPHLFCFYCFFFFFSF